MQDHFQQVPSFFVTQGWGSGAWTEPPTDDPVVKALNRRAFLSDATTFKLFVDGAAVAQRRDFVVDPDLGFIKRFLSEFPDGLTGLPDITGKWYSDSSEFGGTFGVPLLLFQCDLTADFVWAGA